MTAQGDADATFVVVTVGSCLCAVPIADVVETMRPLPVEPIAGAPSFVCGIAILRGIPVPVVDLGLLLAVPAMRGARFVALRLGERRVAMKVDDVVGVRRLQTSTLLEVPSLLGGVGTELVEALGTLDTQLLMVLRASRILPTETWEWPEVTT